MKLTTKTFKIDPKQFKAACFGQTMKTFIRIGIFFTLFCMAFEWFAATQNLLVGLAITMISIPLASVRAAYDQFKPGNLEARNRGFLTNARNLEFTEEGIFAKAESGSNGFTVWTDVERAVKLNGATRIYLSKVFSHYIPDTAWASPGELDEFLSLLRSKSLLK